MEKLWKEIPGTDGKYLISTAGEVMAISRRVKFGHVYRWTKTKLLTPRDNGKGYLELEFLGKHHYIHRLVFVVINLDTGDVYQTPKDASRSTGIHNDSISRVCKGKSKTAGGYRWRYLNE